MQLSNPPIVIVAYNRPKALSRILLSVSRAKYPNNDIPLIISIDGGNDNQNVMEIATNFKWGNGNKIVAYNQVNLGLRKHILKCGDYSGEYGSVIVLEDDLYIADNFYYYACAALKFSKNKDYIGGISLYNHGMNVHTRDNFEPIQSGYDNWYFQFASSWGQAWTKDQWAGFKIWYNNYDDRDEYNEIPANVKNWSDKSWLKYYIEYLIRTQKYFLYPRISYSTNFSDKGTHMGADSTVYQVPLDYSGKTFWNFCDIKESESIYDAFYENKNLFKHLHLKEDEICIDLYGYKNKSTKKYILTTKNLNYQILKSYGRSLKPLDANITQDIKGQDLKLYDTSISKKNKGKNNRNRRLIYNIKHLSHANATFMFLTMTRDRFLRGLKRLFTV